jgi:hypothetical protein
MEGEGVKVFDKPILSIITAFIIVTLSVACVIFLERNSSSDIQLAIINKFTNMPDGKTISLYSLFGQDRDATVCVLSSYQRNLEEVKFGGHSVVTFSKLIEDNIRNINNYLVDKKISSGEGEWKIIIYRPPQEFEVYRIKNLSVEYVYDKKKGKICTLLSSGLFVKNTPPIFNSAKIGLSLIERTTGE